MDENQEEVVYSFTGDTSLLRQATQQAISMLDKYDAAMQKAASKDTFKASKTSTTSFQRTISGLIKQVNTLTTALNSVGDDLQKSMPDGAAVVESATADLADVLSYLDSSSTLVSDDLKFLTEVLKGTKSELESVAFRASVLSTSLKPLEQLNVAQKVEETSNAMATAERKFEAAANAGFRVQDAYVASGKSAVDSAIAFLKAERAATKMTSIQTVMQRLRTDLNLFGAYASKTWKKFAEYISPVTVKLQSFKDKATTILDRVKSLLSQVGSAFRRTSKEADSEGDSFNDLTTKTGKLSGVFGKLSNAASTNSSKFSVLSRVTQTLKRALSGLMGLSIGRWLANAANESIRFTENLNLFTVAMGDAHDQGTEFVDQMQEVFGMDPSNLMRYAGNFYQLADAIDMPDQAAANLSLGLTKATNDIASLFNVDIDQVFENLSSGMQGMSRAIRKYGMDIRSVTLQTTAASFGITQQVEAMSEANRQGLRFITMMKQAANASGDFARTIETPANQLRIFKEQMSQLGRAIGDLFIGPLGKALQYINGFIMALRVAIQFIGTVLGLVNSFGSSIDTEATDDIADSVAGIGGAADGTTKKLKKMLAPFDELIILQTQTDSGGGGGGLGDLGTLDPRIEEAIASMQWDLENVRMKANEVRDALLQFFGFEVDAGKIISWDSDTFEQNLINKFPKWTKIIQATFDNWSSIVNGFKAVFKAAGDVIAAIFDKITGLLSKFVNDDSASGFVTNLSTNLEKLADTISSNKDTIANFVLGIVALKAAFKGISKVATLVRLISKVVSSLNGMSAGLLKFLGIAGAVVAAIVLLYKTSDKFAESFDKLLGSAVGGIVGLAQEAGKTLGTVWEGIKTLWTNNLQPMLAAVGDALAPVLDTVTSLIGNAVSILKSAFGIITELWTSVLQPVLAGLFDIIADIAVIFEQLWTSAIGPVLEYIGSGFVELWNSTLSPIILQIIDIVGGLIDIIMSLWNNVLAPFVSWLVSSLGPSIRMVFETAWNIISAIVGSIGFILSGLLTILQGLIDFLAGVFTGDWSRAWKGIVNILVGIGNSIIGIFELVVNGIIAVFNGLISAIYSSVVGVINMITGVVEDASDLLGFDLELTISAPPPAIPKLTIPKIPMMYGGGTVNAGQIFMARENKMPELVGNFGNTTGVMNNQQIVEAVSNGVYEAVVSAMGEGSGNQETVVEVDGEKLFRIMVGRNRHAIVRTGINPMGG